MHRRFIRHRFLFVVLMLLSIPAGMEIGARIVYAVRLGNAGYLHYPRGAALALNTIVSQAIEQSGVLMKLAPGTHDFIVGGKLLHSIRINESGYRGRDFSNPRAARWTVVTLGGSSTFSSECPDGTSYPEIMEMLWNERYGPQSVEVINRGMNGMSTHQVARLFRTEVAPRRPDLVTVCSAFNGIDPPIYLDLRPGTAPFFRRLLWGRSLFYTALFNSLESERLKTASTPEGIREQYRKDLESMADTARRRGIRLVFVLQPLMDGEQMDLELIRQRTIGEDTEMILRGFKDKQPMHRELLGIMAEVAERRDVLLVDPRPLMTQVPDTQKYFWEALHLTPEGGRMMAGQIVGQLEDRYGGLTALLK